MKQNPYYVGCTVEYTGYYNKFIVLSEKYKIATPIVSKCGCSSLMAVAMENSGMHYYNEDIYDAFRSWGVQGQLDIKSDKYKNIVDELKYVAVIRDPIKRVISAYKTIGTKSASPNDFIENVIYGLENNADRLDRHILSQFKQYDMSKIDMFVNIDDLDFFLNNIKDNDKIEIKRVNCSVRHIKPTKEQETKLNFLLKEDIETYNSILKSDKIYVPGQKL